MVGVSPSPGGDSCGKNQMLPQGIAMLKRQYTVDQNIMAAGILMAILPMILVHLLFQEQIIKGATAGSIEG
jgi:raffinose/stachyose/melibiose transport system permease protein